METSLFHSGIRPAINAGLSVSRVGGAAQTKAVKKVSGTLRLDLASFRELESFTQFGSDLDLATKARLDRGRRTVEILKQGLHQLVSFEMEAVILYALTKGYLDSIEMDELASFEQTLYQEMNDDPLGLQIKNIITETKQLPSDDLLDEFIRNCKKNYK